MAVTAAEAALGQVSGDAPERAALAVQPADQRHGTLFGGVGRHAAGAVQPVAQRRKAPDAFAPLPLDVQGGARAFAREVPLHLGRPVPTGGR